jgi:hypothetical protein
MTDASVEPAEFFSFWHDLLQTGMECRTSGQWNRGKIAEKAE